MLHIVCILEPYLTCGTWHNWVTQNCTQGFVGPCIIAATATYAGPKSVNAGNKVFLAKGELKMLRNI